MLKEREYRLDGLFLPPPQRPDLPAVILEAQMAADPGFLRRALALLVQPEEQVPASSAALRQQVAGTDQALPLADVIAPIGITRFNGRSLKELCAMGGMTLEDFSQSVAYREIFGQGRLEVRQEGELDLTLRQLHRRCGLLDPDQEVRIRALSLERLEALAEALLDFKSPADLVAWLAAG